MAKVIDLQRAGILLVEDGNHGEYRPRPDEFVDQGVAFIRAADINDGQIFFNSASKINKVARERITKGIGAPGDVLLSHKGTVGKLALVPEDAPPFVCSPQTTFWRTLDSDVLERRYLYAFMRSTMFRAQLSTRASETDMAPYVSLTSQRDLTVAIPPIRYQRTISHILGTLDDKIELNRRMNETLETMARAIFKSWFVDFDPVRAKMSGEPPDSICRRLGLTTELLDLFPDRFQDSELGEIPDGWRVSSFGEQIEIYDSKRIPLSNREREKRRGPYPYYGAASVMDYVDDYLFEGLYILMGEDGSVVHDDGTPVTQYVWGKFWVNNHAHVLRAKAPMSNEHLLLLLKQTNIVPFITGAVQPKLSQGNLKSIPHVAAPGDLNAAFGEITEWHFSRKRANEEEISTLSILRDSLLPKLLSGELMVEILGEA